MQEATLTIGAVAREVGVNASTIRYYERVGLLPPPQRTGGQRRYTPDTIQRLHVIAVTKRAGFSLDDAKVLLRSTDEGSPAYPQLRELAARKLPEVDALIERAQAVREWLTTASGCKCETLDLCGLFEDGGEPPDELAADGDGAAELRLTHITPL